MTSRYSVSAALLCLCGVTVMRCCHAAILTVHAYIDGRSVLVVEHNQVWWEHYDYAAPGRHEGANYPTVINDLSWYPEWPYWGEVRQRCSSSVFTIPTLGLASNLYLMTASARGRVAVYRGPVPGAYLIEFDDNFFFGAAWYTVTASYTNLHSKD